jgi:hypothetical protein
LLISQIHDWASRHGGCRTAISFEHMLPGIRKWLHSAELAVIDATDDPAQASDAFLQAVGVLKPHAVAVYTEKTHDGLELLVRSLGAPLLLGPMIAEEWDEFFESMFPSLIPLESAGEIAQPGKRLIVRDINANASENIVYYKPLAG